MNEMNEWRIDSSDFGQSSVGVTDWDIHTELSPRSTENGSKNAKYPVSGSCEEKNVLLMPGFQSQTGQTGWKIEHGSKYTRSHWLQPEWLL